MKTRNAIRMAALALSCSLIAWTQEGPKAELNFDYSFARYAPSASYTQGHSLNGGGGRVKFNVNDWLGLAMDLQGYNSNTSKFTIPQNSSFPNGGSGTVSGNLFTYLFGPVIKVRTPGAQPYFDFLFGAAHSSVYGNAYKTICQPVAGTNPCAFSSSPNGDAYAMSVGGGLDIPINQRVYFRVGEFDYLYTRFSNQFTNAGQNNFRYLGGLGINVGEPNRKPPTMACAAEPSEVLPWAGPVKATTTAADFNPKHTLSYKWESSGTAPIGQGTAASFDTANMQPGQYTVKVTATDPKQKKNNMATCSASFTVKQPRPPLLSCSVTPSTVQAGQPVTITVSGSSPDGSAIAKRIFQANAGTVTEGQTTPGSQPGEFTTTAALDTTGVQPGSRIAINVIATDVHGQTGQCQTEEAMAVPPPAPVVIPARLVGQCQFTDAKKGARVDNQCKAVLDTVALQLKSDPDARVIVVGYAAEEEVATAQGIESLRAANIRFYLTDGDGKQQIDRSRIEIRKSSDHSVGKAGQVYLVPQNGVLQVQGTDTVDEGTLPAKRAGGSGQ